MDAEKLRGKVRLFLQKTKAEQTALIFSAYLFVYFIFFRIEYLFLLNIVPLLLFLAVVLAFREYLCTAWFWALATLLIVLRIAHDWHLAANHDYLGVYLALLMILVWRQPEQERDAFLKRQAGYVFAIVILLAGLQKLLSPEYVNGSQLEFMFLTGDFAGIVFNREAFFAKEIAANKDIIYKFARTFVEDPNVRLEWHSPFFHSISPYLAWIIILSELALGLLALKFFDRTAFHVCLLLFIAGVFITTPEGGFLLMLLIIGWSRLSSKATYLHYAYLSCLFLILSFIITGNSFG